jgi:UDP-galactopyranose mutase
MEDYDIIIVGCGLSGAVIADRYAREKKVKVLVLDKRNHIGGNVYDYFDRNTGILTPLYGAHLFHTNSERVWEYVNKYSEWVRWDHKVIASVDGKLVPMPVNIDTVNALCGENILNEEEMLGWLNEKQVKYNHDPLNSEEIAKSRIGDYLYEKLVRDYTFKQWNKYPCDLDASVLQRLPYRTNRDSRYFNDRYQALPKHGYTKFVENILAHPNITVKLSFDFFEIKDKIPQGKIIIYTGPIDHFYASLGLPKLEYRSIDFKYEYFKNMNYFQTNSVVNYPGPEVEYTRIVEPKHFLNQSSKDTLIIKEYTTDVGDPYYPVPTPANQDLFQLYRSYALMEKNVHFIGRLANYKYFNMDQAILNALEYYDENLI